MNEENKGFYLGSCVDSFDLEGNCLVDLPWSHVSDFAYAEENSQELTLTEFLVGVSITEISGLIENNTVKYFQTPDDIFMIYDVDKDIHYFFKSELNFSLVFKN